MIVVIVIASFANNDPHKTASITIAVTGPFLPPSKTVLFRSLKAESDTG